MGVLDGRFVGDKNLVHRSDADFHRDGCAARLGIEVEAFKNEAGQFGAVVTRRQLANVAGRGSRRRGCGPRKLSWAGSRWRSNVEKVIFDIENVIIRLARGRLSQREVRGEEEILIEEVRLRHHHLHFPRWIYSRVGRKLLPEAGPSLLLHWKGDIQGILIQAEG